MSTTTSISPNRLRSDIYSFPCNSDSPPPLVISVLASLIDRAVAKTHRIAACEASAKQDLRIRAFESRRVLEMSIQSFLDRIFRYARVSPPVFVVAYVYFDRLCELNPSFFVSDRNVHRLLITAVLVASKFIEDMNYRNSYFAKIGGISTQEMNRLELNLLFLMGFKLQVSVSVFESYCRHLEREVSFGGGFQIERSLRSVCAAGIFSGKKEKKSPQVKKSHILKEDVRCVNFMWNRGVIEVRSD
ncbi:cyclin-U2-2-like [Phalaenopsis equestris]|uniref:cyclin-U2-2-like n=1 Tax=Phalaenopsis equestris TaxID=78828 RepID=UPI0009E42533|nr:cyclin-U2-2-like [Phalaenopsis equestris]